MTRLLRLAGPTLGLALLLAAPAPAQDDDPWRLGDEVVPTAQSVQLRLDPSTPDYSGSTRIDVVVQPGVSQIRLHARGPEVHSAVLLAAGERVELEGTPGEGELLLLGAGRELPAGEATLELGFHASGDQVAQGLYRIEHEGEGYFFTQFEATDARAAFPCFDEPRFKIPFQLTLEAPVGTELLANTPVVAEGSEAGWRRVEFAPTPPMPSYLVAMAAGPFEYVDVPGLDIPTRIVTPAGSAHLAREAVELTPGILRALEGYFGQPYPYAKLDMIAVPEFWPGAMENVGLITYRDTLLLLDPGATSLAQRRNLARVIAHELAHQWFGNLVTMQWWDDLWLNEAFATWLGNKITHEVHPDFGMDISARRGSLGAMDTDAQLVARAIRQAVKSTDNMMQAADGLTYQKGAAVLGMFENFVGADRFREGVRGYLAAHEWGNATAADLFASLSEAAGVELAPALSSFLDQPGVPVISVVPVGEGKVELSQRRYSAAGAVPPVQTWQVPVVLRSWVDGEPQEHRVWLREETQVVELGRGAEPGLLLPDSGATGYYRWELPPSHLDRLCDRAPQELAVVERVDLVSQLSALLDAGQLDGGSYLERAAQMLGDPRPEVSSTALGQLSKVQGAFVTAELEGAFAGWVHEQLAPLVERHGLDPVDGEPEAVTLLRPSLVRWYGGPGRDPGVREHARSQFARALEGEPLESSMESVWLSLGVLDGGWSEWNAVKQRFEAATVPAQRSRWLSALGRFEDEGIARASLRYALTSGELKPQELFTIPMGVGQTFPNDPIVWEWFTANYDAIRDLIPDMFAAYLVYFAGGCDRERLAEAEEFFSHPDRQVTGQDKEWAKVAEAVTDCAELREREGAEVAAVLARYQPAPAGR